jgi:hypothetical protein
MAFNGGTSTINCPSITPGTTTGISLGNAELTINGNVIGAATASTLIQTSSSGSRLRMNGKVTATSGGIAAIGIAGGSNIITGDVLHSGTGIAISHVSGNVTILNSQITTSGAGAPISKFIAGGVIRLRDVYLFSVTAANTITGPAGTNVIALGCYSNNPLGANVTVIGDMKIGDTVAATVNQVPVSLANGAWNWASLPSATTLAGNVVIVDAVNGNDSTGLAGDLTKPFLTLLAAQAAASPGQTIVVYPGTYASTALGKNGVDWYFMPNTQVNFSVDCWTTPTLCNYEVRGSGFFSTGAGFLAQVTNLSTVVIDCARAQSRNGFSCAVAGSSLTINVAANWTVASPNTSSTLVNGTARINVGGTYAIIGTIASIPFQISGGSLIFSGNISCGVGPSALINFVSGSLSIRDSDVNTTTLIGPTITRLSAGSGLISLNNVDIRTNIAQPFSISSAGFPQQVICKNSSVNLPVDSTDVSVFGNLQYNFLNTPLLGQVPTANADGTWEWTASTGGAALAGNVVIVDAINGDDATGAVGDLTKPFLTLVAAQTAASAGQTIVVYPGTYTAALLGKNGVNWYFMPGATVNFSTNSAFAASGVMSYSVFGYGIFTVNGWLARLDSPASNVYIECQSAESNIGFEVVQTTSSLQIIVRETWRITVNNVGSGVLNSGSTAYVKARELIVLAGVTIPFVVAGNTTIEADRFACTGTPSTMFSLTGGDLTLVRSRITATALTGPVILQDPTSGSQVILVNTVIQGNSLQAAIEGGIAGVSVNSQASQSVQGLGSNVTVLGNLQVNSLTIAGVGEVPTANADGTWSWA